MNARYDIPIISKRQYDKSNSNHKIKYNINTESFELLQEIMQRQRGERTKKKEVEKIVTSIEAADSDSEDIFT